ncbi:phospholipase A2 inhibitor LNF1-like [Lissotriton helveticus]
MKAFLSALVMLQALITGDCLLCEKCLATGTTQCSGIFKQCSPDVTHCVTGLENNTFRNSVIVTTFKDCLNPSEQAACGREFHLHNSVLSFRIIRTCCDSDFCNGGDDEVPALDETPNGYKCDKCFTGQSSGSCTPTGEVQCTGEQDTCIIFSGKAIIPGGSLKPYNLKGCVSRDYCDLFYIPVTQVYSEETRCVPAKKL